jgi:hypothetical protein
MSDNKIFLKVVGDNNGAPEFGAVPSSSYATIGWRQPWKLSKSSIRALREDAADHARAPWRCLYCRRTFNPKDEFCDGCGAPLPL